MLYCPSCGSPIKESETYCFKCGKKIPLDLNERMNHKASLKKQIIPPLITLFCIIVISSSVYFILQLKSSHAKQYYDEGESYLLDGKYEEAKRSFDKARKGKKSFIQAQTAYAFTEEALSIQKDIDEANKWLEEDDYAEAIKVLTHADQQLKSYYGEAVNLLLEQVNHVQQTIEVEKLKSELDEEPNIDDLKLLLWDAEALNGEQASEMTEHIKSQIIEYVYSHANELLNKKQFSEAQNLVEDGLKYVPESEKIQSLKATISNERTSFETEQQERIEQAVSAATKEHQDNQNHAITLEKSSVKKDDQDRVTVTGEVKSKATIPVNSVLVEYDILNDKKKKIASNKVFVFPETLSPDEKGKFEFTHYDLDKVKGDLKVEVNKITWYTE